MPGSPAALAEAVLQAQSILGTVWDKELQQSTPRGQDSVGSRDVTLLPGSQHGHGTIVGSLLLGPSQSAPPGCTALEDVPENISSSDTNGYSSHSSLLSRHRVSPAPPPQP